MRRTLNPGRDEAQLQMQLIEALGSSLDVDVVLSSAYPLLTRLVPADYGALGISASGQPRDFRWSVAQLPKAYFESYPAMAGHDFVRRAVAERPNVVLRDQDMLSRAELEASPLYHRAREVGAPLQQVMAVMLHVDARWQSGLSLYRERRRPFSSRERALLQRVTPALANAVRNCHSYGEAADWKSALDQLLEGQAESVLLVGLDGSEVARTPGVTPILERWFEPHELRGGRLPEPLSARVAAALTSGQPSMWRKQASPLALEVTVAPLTGSWGRSRCLLRFRQRSEALVLPPSWRSSLTSREQQVTTAVLRGWDNKLIGEDLSCAEATVKKHLQAVFAKLGVESRAALIARAAQLQ